MDRTTSCTLFSDHGGLPSGRILPLLLGISPRRTGVHCHRSSRMASIIVALCSCDIPSTVSSVMPGVMAPSCFSNVAYARRDMAGLASGRYTSSHGSFRFPRSWVMCRIVSAVRISRTFAFLSMWKPAPLRRWPSCSPLCPCGRLARPLTPLGAPSPEGSRPFGHPALYSYRTVAWLRWPFRAVLRVRYPLSCPRRCVFPPLQWVS